MKKIKLTIFSVILFCIMILSPNFVFADSLYLIETNAKILNNGDMDVIQKWTFNDSGSSNTEHYIPININGEYSIRDIVVYHNDKPMQRDSNEWNVDRSFEEKIDKYGVKNTDNGIEICWGISNKVDNNTFYVKYTVKNALEKTEDGVNFLHWQFINDSIDPSPDKVKLTLKAPENYIDRAWAFGFEGNLSVNNGEVVVENTEKFSSPDKLILLASMRNSIPAGRLYNGDFNDKLKQAFKGSDYNLEEAINGATKSSFSEGNASKSKPFLITFLIQSGLITTFIIAALSKGLGQYVIGESTGENLKYDIKLSKNKYYRDNPGDFMRYLKNSGLISDDADILTYYLTKWILEGDIRVIDASDDKNVILDFCSAENIERLSNRSEYSLYRILSLADRDYKRGFLSRTFGKDYNEGYEHLGARVVGTQSFKYLPFDSILSILKQMELEGIENLEKEGYTENVDTGGRFIKSKYQFTDIGELTMSRFAETSNFIKDFTLIAERDVTEVELWGYHFAFASLFGLAEKLEKQIRKYPDLYKQDRIGMDMYTYTSLRMINRSMNSGYKSYVSRSSGGGGSSSHGGGGGSSGGGSGGGSR